MRRLADPASSMRVTNFRQRAARSGEAEREGRIIDYGGKRRGRTCWIAAKSGSDEMSRKTRSLRMSPRLSCGTGSGGALLTPCSGRKFTSVWLSLNTYTPQLTASAPTLAAHPPSKAAHHE